MFLSFDRPEGELPSLNEHCFFFHFSIDVKTYHGDSARPVILLGANDQISRTALTGYRDQALIVRPTMHLSIQHCLHRELGSLGAHFQPG